MYFLLSWYSTLDLVFCIRGLGYALVRSLLSNSFVMAIIYCSSLVLVLT